jgi:hypothetical protein
MSSNGFFKKKTDSGTYGTVTVIAESYYNSARHIELIY